MRIESQRVSRRVSAVQDEGARPSGRVPAGRGEGARRARPDPFSRTPTVEYPEGLLERLRIRVALAP